MSPNKKWLSGGFTINDHEIDVPDPKQINPNDLDDMSPLGDWIDYTNFNASASEEDRKGNCFQ